MGPLPDWSALLDQPGTWPVGPSATIDYMSEERPGDIRRCWELSRHQYFLVLGRGWRRERDPRWAECFVRHLVDWICRNPPGTGPHWIQAQEVALRAISWAYAWHLFHDAPVFTPQVRRLLLKALSWHLRFLEREVCAFGKWTHNHLISELAGIHVLGMLFPQLRGAPRLARWSRRLLEREVIKQIWADGLSGELSSAYQSFVLDNLLSVLACGREAWRDTVLESRAAAMGEALAWLTRPDGSLPLVGDSDSGRGWLLCDDLVQRSSYGQLPALLLGKPGPPWTPERPAPEWRWLLPGASIVTRKPHLPAPAGQCFVEGGIWCWREHSGIDSRWLLLRGGATRRRRWVQQSHHHADVLSFEYAHHGQALFVDPGTYAYGLETELRQEFRSSHAHNGLWVEGTSPCDFRGLRFGVWNLPLSRWLATPTDELGATMAVNYGSVRHQRRLRVLPEGLEIEDQVERPAHLAAGLGFQLASGVDVHPAAAGWCFPGVGLELVVLDVEGGEVEWIREEGFVSLRYAEKRPAPRLRLLLPSVGTCRVRLRLRPTQAH